MPGDGSAARTPVKAPRWCRLSCGSDLGVLRRHPGAGSLAPKMASRALLRPSGGHLVERSVPDRDRRGDPAGSDVQESAGPASPAGSALATAQHTSGVGAATAHHFPRRVPRQSPLFSARDHGGASGERDCSPAGPAPYDLVGCALMTWCQPPSRSASVPHLLPARRSRFKGADLVERPGTRGYDDRR